MYLSSSFLPLRVAITVMMMMMMMISTSVPIGSIDLNDQCPEGDYFSKEKLSRNIETVSGRHRTVTVTVSPADTEKESQSENR